ncbi:MAG TPA: C40 family peptidase [Hyphomicrobiales bacterium]|nr:C40 family peptidase [Hyphomicrobiales bacterium]
MNALDPRLTAARPDLAAAHLRGRVVAERFVEGSAAVVAVGHAPLRAAPRDDAPLLTEALMGEPVTVYDRRDGWAWAQLDDDGYVGWMPETALTLPGPAVTHRVVATLSFIFPTPSIKVPPRDTVPMGARVAVTDESRRLAALAGGGFLPATHLAPHGSAEFDFVAVAERFVGAPYLWGGKTAAGIDCSGLVQVALAMTGVVASRDTDLQEAALGRPVADWTPATLRRGDLLFWPGHVAIVLGHGRMIHANAHHMAVAIEPIAEAVARIAAVDSPVSSVRRLTRRPAAPAP